MILATILLRMIIIMGLRTIIIMRMRIIINYPKWEWLSFAGEKVGMGIAYITWYVKHV